MRTSIANSPSSRFKIFSLLLITALLTGLIFSFAPARPAQVASAAPINVGLITDAGGVNDNSFNYLANQGLLRAEADFGVVGNLYESQAPEDYATNLAKCVTDGNSLCVAVGFLMGEATLEAAGLYPETKFAIVDYPYETYPANLRSLYFEVDQPAYLAGVLASLMSQSDIIGDIGGWTIPTVTPFTEPYRNGAMCTNTGGKVLLAYTYDFNNPSLGALAAQMMVSRGADVIFAPAGNTGTGAVLSATQSGKWGIGVDIDYYSFAFGNGTIPGANKLLTSVLKKIDNAVYDTISDVVSGTFTSGPKTYNMANDGTGLAPYHETDALISPAIKTQLAQVKSQILAGTINVHDLCTNPSTVKVGLVTDTGGINDFSFNMLAYQGLLLAQADFDAIATHYYEPASAEDFAPLLAQCVANGNDLCVSVGFTMKDATLAVAMDYPGKKFAIVDESSYETYPPNLRGLAFAVEQPSYLAGVLSGLMSQSKVVGDLGGMEIPQVTAFTLPYRNGALCGRPGGSVLLAYSGDFDNPDHGAQLAQGMISDGADVIFAPAGVTGMGAILSATQSGVWGIGVDTDWYGTVFGNGSVPGSDKLLTSVVKKINNAVYLTVAEVVGGAFTSGTKTYAMSNDGTGLAPFHETEALVPAFIKVRLNQVKNDLLAGKIDINSTACSNYTFTFIPTIKR